MRFKENEPILYEFLNHNINRLYTSLKKEYWILNYKYTMNQFGDDIPDDVFRIYQTMYKTWFKDYFKGK